jgi:flagellar motor switch/type III secretory pathway protein FliN
MAADRLRAFPWAALSRLSRAEVEASFRARRQLDGHVDLGQLAQIATKLSGAPVEITERGVRIVSSEPEPFGVRVRLVSEGAPSIVVDVEDALAARLAASVLGRSIAFVDPSLRASAEVAGAAGAFLVTLARRAGGGTPFRLGTEPIRVSTLLVVSVVVLVGDDAFEAVVTVPLLGPAPRPVSFSPALLRSLGGVPISLSLVCATLRLDRGDLRRMEIGGALASLGGAFPLGGTKRRAFLLAPDGEMALPVEVRGALGEPVDVVLTDTPVPLSWDDPAMTSPERPNDPSAAEALGEAAIVLRVEVASVSLSASAWASLRPGDVVATGVRIGEPVTLRAGGIAFARGELCDLDGELAVRILERTGESP